MYDYDDANQLTSIWHKKTVTIDDFRKNARGKLGTRTATLHKEGVKKLRENWIYRL